MLRKSENIQTTRRVNIEMINASPDLMMRVELSKSKIAEYAEAIKLGAEFPPLDCAEVEGELLLYDGFLRYNAHKKQRATEVAVRIRVAATHDEAVLWAVQANAYQGLKRSNLDKQKSVLALLNTERFSGMTNEEIAGAAGVDPETVRKYKKQEEIKRTSVYHTVKTPDATRIDKSGRKRPTTYAPRKPKTADTKPASQPGSRNYTPPYQKMQWPTDAELGKPSLELQDQPHPDHPGMTYLQVFRKENPGYVHAIPRDRKLKENRDIAVREITGRVREIGQLCKTLSQTIPAKISVQEYAAALNAIASSAMWQGKLDLHRADIDAMWPVVRELLDITRKDRK